jgi:hypothetical protein
MAVSEAYISSIFSQVHARKHERKVAPDGIAAAGTGFSLIHTKDNGVDYYELSDKNKSIGGVSFEQCAHILSAIDDLGSPSDHLWVKFDTRWRKLYHYASRQFSMLKRDGNLGSFASNSYPCHYCGLFVPEAMIQVDHQHAQGKFAGDAVMKVLRAIDGDLTVAESKGTKGGQAEKIIQKKTTQLQPVPTKGYPFDGTWSQKNIDQNRTDRYTLSNYGRTIVSLGCLVFGDSAFEKCCVNNVLNLVPACPRCNLQKNAKRFAKSS